MKIHYVVFDFDGTLIDSAPSILACFSDVLAARGLEPKTEIDSRLIGPPLLETLARISGISITAELQNLADDFKRLYDEIGLFETELYPGIEAMLKDLRAAGYRLHIATNKRLRPTRLILDHLGLGQLFDSVYAVDRAVPHYASKAAMIAAQLTEQGLSARQGCYVGDKTEDGIAAEVNTLPFYAATWGYGDWDAETLPAHWSIVAAPSMLPAHLCG